MPTSRRSPTKPRADAPLAAVREQIVACTRCERLRTYCRPRRPREEGRAPRRRVLGRAQCRVRRSRRPRPHHRPRAGGTRANRTGRVFTGDGVGGSGDFPDARDARIGLREHADIAAPAGRPRPARRVHRRRRALRRRTTSRHGCHLPHLVAETNALSRVRIIVALGRIAFDSAWRLLADRGIIVRPRPAFAHNAAYAAGSGTVIASCPRAGRTRIPASSRRR